MGKKPQNYVQERNETCKFEQKPVDIDVSNEEEEKIVKEMVEKLKIRRREVTGKNKFLEKKSRAGQKSKREMWDRLRELNKGFKDIKEHKKDI